MDDLEEIQNDFPEEQENGVDEINAFEQIDETDFLNIRQGLENDFPFQESLETTITLSTRKCSDCQRRIKTTCHRCQKRSCSDHLFPVCNKCSPI